MNRRIVLMCFSSFLLSAFFVVATVEAEEIELFVMAGQSNMQGWQGNAANYPADPKGIDRNVSFYWVTPKFSSSGGRWTFLRPQGGRFPKGHFGPEVTFARLLVMEGHNAAIFKYSLGSAGLIYTWKAPGHHGMYDRMVAEIRKAVTRLQSRGHTISFRALVWIQGESDAESEDVADLYASRLKWLIDDFRANVAKEDHLPILLGVDEQHAWVRRYPKVLEAQQGLARDDPNIVFTSMIGLEKADDTHLSPKGLEEHGARLFSAYKILLEARGRPIAKGN